MSSEFVIFTSIPPALNRICNGTDIGPAYQRECVVSWRNAGFSVVSLNATSEVDAVKSLNLPVRVESLASAGPPAIADILALASNEDAKMCGIINADCMLIGYPRLAPTIARHAEASLIIAERVDFDADTDLPIPGTTGGFDAFFFRPSSVVGIRDRFFHLGDPCWDYWFPIELASRGITIQTLSTPIISHLLHPRAWTHASLQSHAEYFWNYLQRLEGEGQVPAGLPIRDQKLRKIRDWLRQRPERRKIHFFDSRFSDAETLLQKLRRSHLIDGECHIKDIRRLERKIRRFDERLAAEKAMNRSLVHLEKCLTAELASVYQSSSWRFSKPLRAFKNLIAALRSRSGC